MGRLNILANRVISNRTKKRLKFWRARLFESLGSSRYSRPALFQMDERLRRYLGEQPGFFVECGANDGYTQSNTYYLSRYRGWKGLLIEPIPMLYDLCRRFRPESTVVNCALGADDGGRARMVYSDLMSTTIGARDTADDDLAFARQNGDHVGRDGHFEVDVPVRRLSSVLDEVGVTRIDLFVLDVEGFELQVLAGVDFDRHEVAHLLVETTNLPAVTGILGRRFELLTALSHHDYLFRRCFT